jgi:DNA helicase-2/ATP-dependent DNA helicase PcrA
MTRAKDKLFLTAAKYYGEGKREKKISPFVIEALGEISLESNSQNKKNQLSLFEAGKTKKATEESSFHLPSTLSYSQLETYDTCNLKYKYSYILSLPSLPSAPLSFGSAIHETLCDFYQKAMAGQKPDKEVLLKALEENWKPFGFSSKEHQEKYKKEGEKILGEYFEKGYNPSSLPLALEVPFAVKISDSLKIVGKIDRIDKTEKGIEIIDYKTGKSAPQKEVDKDLQLTLYALAISDGSLKHLGIENGKQRELKVSFYFLNNQEKVSSVKSVEELQSAREEILKKVEEMATSDFSPKPGRHCDFCEFKVLCESWS